MSSRLRRRHALRGLLGSAVAMALAGCDRLSHTTWFPRMLDGAQHLNRGVHKLLTGRNSMAQEFSEQDLSPDFRSNGTAYPVGDAYARLVESGFTAWQLEVDGLVAAPQRLSLAALRALPSRTQITRHDCVEGWSAIAKWKGVPLAAVLALARPLPEAKFVVFHCADAMGDDGKRYYESIDMEDAWHPQTILAYDMNDAALPIKNGAPLRARVERQLGYKHAKYLMRLELAADLDAFGAGNGGYWEDLGYSWYAGI